MAGEDFNVRSATPAALAWRFAFPPPLLPRQLCGSFFGGRADEAWQGRTGQHTRMNMRLIFLSILVLVAARFSAFSAEDNFNATVGGIKIVIPVPGQFAEVGEGHRTFPEGMSNRLLAEFIPADDMKNGKQDSQKWMQIQVMKTLENHDLTKSEFTQVSEKIAKQQDELFTAAKDEVNGLLKKSTSGVGAGLQIGQMKPMGTFGKTNDSIGVLSLMGLDDKSKAEQGAAKLFYCASNFLRVKDRHIFAYVYASAENEGALVWVKSVSERWVADILKANAGK